MQIFTTITCFPIFVFFRLFIGQANQSLDRSLKLHNDNETKGIKKRLKREERNVQKN